VAASRPYTWNNSTPGFKLTERGPEALGSQLDAAIKAKGMKGEQNGTAFGYEFGSPQQKASDKLNPRFAGGEGIVRFLNGDFGGIANGDDTESKAQLGQWANLFASGPFSPFGPPMDGAPPPPPGSEKTA
jgi:hypothetical protein